MAENDKKNKLFRKAALDRLSSPEQLHTLMRVTDAKGWLALVGCTLIIVTTLAWAVVGSMQTKVAAAGILLGGGGLVELAAQGDGEITSIEVQAGDLVKRDQVVAKIAQPALVQQIKSLERRIEELNQDADAGTLSPSASGRRDRLKGDLERLQKQLEENDEIVSHVSGRVVELRAVAGEHVAAGKPIVAVERSGNETELEALLYFDSQNGKSLKPGMTIEIMPSTVRKERHGVLLGKVKVVDHYPSTRLGMMGALRNEQLVDSFIQAAGGAPIAVRASMLPDKSTASGYRWSSGAGPDIKLTSGTQCRGAVITRTHRPIALVFPALD
ncbi:MAG: NHLP bacteriocin system secretion protein [Labilithrix sp.]|nr:NHLP bacteriocin system secretion protein [Labilithrix sp.]